MSWSVSSFTFAWTATSSSSCRADDHLPMPRIEHQLRDTVRGGRADLVKIGVAQQQLERLANMSRGDRADDHAAQGGRTARVLSCRLTWMEAVGDVPLDG